MLVLRRKEQEKILIDGNIEITVIKIEGRKVKIGIEAPVEVSVSRPEMKRHKPDKRLDGSGR